MNPLRAAILQLALIASAWAQIPAELVVVNANIRTMDPAKPRASAVAIRGGRLAGVGTDEQIRTFVSSSTRVVDAAGRLMLPGFNDSHVHFTGVGNWFSHLDASSLDTLEKLRSRIAHFTRFLPTGRWLIGAKLDPKLISSQALADLDSVSPNNPLLIYLRDPASAWANSRALRAGGFHPDREPGNGVVTGPDLLRIRNAIPKDHGRNWAEIAEAASNYAASLGVTSIQDVHSDNLLGTYRMMARSGRLKTRIYECVGLEAWEKDPSIADKAASGDEMVRGGCVKWMIDGENEERSELVKRIARADSAGIQVAIHTIGSRANRELITVFSDAVSRNGERDRRFRIEHAHRIARSEIVSAAKIGIVLSMQPALFYSNMDSGDEYPFVIRIGARLALGSDASMIDIDPLAGIHAAVNSGANSISIEDAVRAYTLGSAYAEFQEREKGSISPGKLADLVILSDDIFSVAPDRIQNGRIIMTIVGGKIVYESR